jgi:RimJ/RimL family protein N-acetyltransferase
MIPLPLATIRGPNVTLRRPRPEDVDARHAIGLHAEVVQSYGIGFDASRPFTREDAAEEIANIERQPYAWVIDAGGFVGSVRFHGVDITDRRAAIAIGIDDPKRHGLGLGAEAISLALGHGFSSGLHRVGLRVLATNTRAISCYRKCGFVEEGRERESALVGGTWVDDVMMGILSNEFYKRTDANRLQG